MKALKYLNKNRKKEPLSYGLTTNGHRYSVFFGIFCEVCDDDITGLITKLHQVRTCPDCYAHDALVISILKTLLLDDKGKPDELMPIEAKRNIRHAIAYLSDRSEYEQYMVTELIKGDMAQSLAVKQALHDRVCDCKAKV